MSEASAESGELPLVEGLLDVVSPSSVTSVPPPDEPGPSSPSAPSSSSWAALAASFARSARATAAAVAGRFSVRSRTPISIDAGGMPVDRSDRFRSTGGAPSLPLPDAAVRFRIAAGRGQLLQLSCVRATSSKAQVS